MFRKIPAKWQNMYVKKVVDKTVVSAQGMCRLKKEGDKILEFRLPRAKDYRLCEGRDESITDLKSITPNEKGNTPVRKNHLYMNLPDHWNLEKINPEIIFYRRESNEIKAMPVKFNHETIPSNVQLDYSDSRRIIFITHGLNNGIDEEWMKELKDNLLDVEDQTVALVGWGDGAKFEDGYPQNVANSLRVGMWVSDFIKTLYTPDRYIWGIGHSLGAHLMGMAGGASQGSSANQTNKSPMFKRITGLDPAGPGFHTTPPGFRRLCENDADMVDIIHTNGHNLGKDIALGTLLPSGTIDFYPNYGFDHTRPSIKNHFLAIKYFQISLNNAGLFKTKLVLDGKPKVEVVGEKVIVNPIYNLRTAAKAAEMGYFCGRYEAKGNYFIKMPRLKEK